MPTIVVEAPLPILDPEDIAGDHDANDPLITALIAAATEEIDGPTGWLGRALGPQTLETHLDEFPCGTIHLPVVPVISVESIVYDDADGEAQTLEDTTYSLERMTGLISLTTGSTWPSTVYRPGSVRIRYVAGYDGDAVVDGGTGAVPERVLQAVKLIVQDMQAVQTTTGNVKVEQVEGIGRTEYFEARTDGVVISRTVARLLGGLRVFA